MANEQAATELRNDPELILMAALDRLKNIRAEFPGFGCSMDAARGSAENAVSELTNDPDLVTMASEGMKKARAEDSHLPAEQTNKFSKQCAKSTSRVATASPLNVNVKTVSRRARPDAHISFYEYQVALSLKELGNYLLRIGRFTEAAMKYLEAKSILRGNVTYGEKNLKLTCSLNIMSCYLKTGMYDAVIAEATEALKANSRNFKVLFCRGQAYIALGNPKLAIADLQLAVEGSPEKTLSEVLRQAQKDLKGKEGEESSLSDADGPITAQDITDEDAQRLSARKLATSLDSITTSSTENCENPSTSSPGKLSLSNDLVMGESSQPITDENAERFESSESPDDLVTLPSNKKTNRK